MTKPLATPPAATPTANRSQLAKGAAVGLVSGLLSGAFGVGGGLLIVPALVMIMKMDQRRAHGTSLAAVLPIALSSLIGYTLGDKVDWSAGALLAIGAVAGAVLGTHVLHLLPERTVAIIFAAFLIVSAVRLVLDHDDATGRESLSAVTAVALIAVGAASGILAGLLGVGGGIILVPAMVIGFGIPAAIAKGTSLAVIIPTSIIGTWRNRRKRNADIQVAFGVGACGIVSAFVGAKLSIHMSESLSNALFAAFLGLIAVRMGWQLARERTAR